MELKIAVSKTNKYAVSESGDSVELTERPLGGLSIIMADGQGSGRSARINSRLVVSKAAALISDGARDGAVARAVHDMLFSLRDGRVSATLTIISADFATRTLVVCQNGGPPVFVLDQGAPSVLSATAPAIGVHRKMKPNVCEFPLEPGLTLLAMTDGIYAAGKTKANPWTDDELIAHLTDLGDNPDFLASHVLEESVKRDGSRAVDDMSAVALYVDFYQHETKVRKMSARLQC